MSQSAPCAFHLLEVIPRVMDTIRSLVRDERGGLTVPQLRVLALLDRQPQATLAEVATFIGIGAPTASAMIKTLGRKNLIRTTPGKDDRRTMAITLTDHGQALVVRAKDAAHAHLAERLSHLSHTELDLLEHSLQLLSTHVTNPLHQAARV